MVALGGAATSAGAVYAWEGNSKVGAGCMKITDAKAPGALAIKLDFLRPFESHNLTDFSFKAVGGSTLVNWAMTGPMPFVSTLMQVFISMDKRVGKDFEAGLAKPKAAAEK